MRWLAGFFLWAAATSAMAETVVATRTIRAQEIISADDVKLAPATVAGAHSTLDAVIGKEARVAIYPGRAVLRNSVGAPALIERNAIIELVFQQGGLRIVTEGRALARGAVGERVRVQNLASRATLFGTVTPTGAVLVTQ